MSAREFWRLTQPIDSFFFDCDGTLTLVEGIDELAAMNGVADEVQAITARCMSTTGLSLPDYRARLESTRPTKSQLHNLVEIYRANIPPGVLECINILHKLHKSVYIISAGIKSTVVEFAKTLGVAAENVFAVDVFFNSEGEYSGFDEESYLVQPMGKSKQIAAILKKSERSLLLGDGLSDWEASETVTRFIGYAGLKGKDSVKSRANFFINSTSVFSLLPLGLTLDEFNALSQEDKTYYQRGLAEIDNGQVIIKE